MASTYHPPLRLHSVAISMIFTLPVSWKLYIYIMTHFAAQLSVLAGPTTAWELQHRSQGQPWASAARMSSTLSYRHHHQRRHHCFLRLLQCCWAVDGPCHRRHDAWPAGYHREVPPPRHLHLVHCAAAPAPAAAAAAAAAAEHRRPRPGLRGQRHFPPACACAPVRRAAPWPDPLGCSSAARSSAHTKAFRTKTAICVHVAQHTHKQAPSTISGRGSALPTRGRSRARAWQPRSPPPGAARAPPFGS